MEFSARMWQSGLLYREHNNASALSPSVPGRGADSPSGDQESKSPHPRHYALLADSLWRLSCIFWLCSDLIHRSSLPTSSLDAEMGSYPTALASMTPLAVISRVRIEYLRVLCL